MWLAEYSIRHSFCEK